MDHQAKTRIGTAREALRTALGDWAKAGHGTSSAAAQRKDPEAGEPASGRDTPAAGVRSVFGLEAGSQAEGDGDGRGTPTGQSTSAGQ